jgi:hypothetical protein
VKRLSFPGLRQTLAAGSECITRHYDATGDIGKAPQMDVPDHTPKYGPDPDIYREQKPDIYRENSQFGPLAQSCPSALVFYPQVT